MAGCARFACPPPRSTRSSFAPAWTLPVESDTEALWHFDEGAGSIAADAAEDHDATIAGATWVEAGSCLGVADPPTSHCYFRLAAPSAWIAALSTCAGADAHLVTIGSAAENTFVDTNFSGDKWAGLTDLDSEGTFVWSNGEPVTYTNWAEGEPDNNSSLQDCVRVASGGLWTDDECYAETGRMFIGVWERD